MVVLPHGTAMECAKFQSMNNKKEWAVAGYLKTAVVLAALSLAAGCATGPSRDVELNEQGYNAMQAGDMQQAESLLKEALAENPNNPHAHTNLGSLYQNTDRPEMARTHYERVIALAAERGNDSSEEGRELSRLAALARANLELIDRQQAEREMAEQEVVVEEVEVEVVEVPAPVGPDYRAQIGAFSKPANAERARDQFLQRHGSIVAGKDVYLVEVNGLTKVQVGSFASINEASQTCRTLKRAGVDCFPTRL